MENFRFGKQPKREDKRTLNMAKYISALPAPDLAFENLQSVYGNLKITDPAILFPMDGNDSVGDCTIAGIAHGETVYSGLIGKKKIPSLRLVLKVYYKLTGGQDTGLNELDVLNYWRKRTFDCDKIIAYAEIDPKNHLHVQQAIRYFGGIYLGFNVQQNAIKDFNNKVPWTPGVLTGDGHAVYATGYDQNYVTVLTWGNTQKGTWAWWDKCVDEAYAIIPPEAKKPGFCPGFSFAQLQADLAQVTN